MYRTNNFDSPIIQQMKLACLKLYEWQKFHPAISGGALWSWAASQQARDIDIFVKNGWFSGARKKARSLIVDKSRFVLGEDVEKNGYGGPVTVWKPIKRIYVYKGKLEDDTSFDLVLTPHAGLDIINYFDYYHCMVAFSPEGIDLDGVSYYINKKLKKSFRSYIGIRDENIMKEKIRSSLWGNPNAEVKMNLVMLKLKEIYNLIREDNGKIKS